MKFADIKGQEDIKEHLQNAIALGKTSHAYIISGEKDAGKMMLAEAFAQTLLCQDRGQGCLRKLSFLQAVPEPQPPGYPLCFA